MTFFESIRTCFTKYADFNGCATRSEFWWWVLFYILASAVLGLVSQALAGIFALATLVPYIAVTARRLHDTDRSGWLQLLALIPIIGWIILIVWCVQEGKQPNRFCAAASAPA
jgi:uncharacterized membrane protein YhaH (DUF805 family)